MNLILISTLSMGGLAAVFALFLSIANKKLKVEEDPRVEQILGYLPGVNCGACGRASCRSLAEAMVKGEALASACVPGGNDVGEKIAALMGVESGSTQSKVAFLHCGALHSERRKKAEYEGVKSCQAANLLMGGDLACGYGCLGYGDCQASCPFDAIIMNGGLPRVDAAKCTGCGNCVRACPRSLITLEVLDGELHFRVVCSSLDKGKKARKVCEKACIACGLCVKVCPFDACELQDNLAVIDQRNCQTCGVCAPRCPTGAISLNHIC
jgi:Na+-translocating ferredoxin:NAD+ oxidoreductase RNF subunit RnfB